jgi:hypothetical protein
MIGSTTRQVLSVMLVVTGGVSIPKDTTRKIVGYAGVLPIPDMTMPAAPKSDAVDARKDTRSERGRVLYAAGHAPVEAKRPVAEKKAHGPCSKQQLVQTPRPNSLPNT